MNRSNVLLSMTLAAALCCTESQAQTPADHLPSAPSGSDALKITGDATASNAGASDHEDAANLIRIVRLSQASGKVEIDRNAGYGFEAAFNNLPITQGARLKTSEGSAEVELEDGTTLRLIPGTQVDFTQLARSASGATLSGMNVLRGTVYVSLSKAKGNTFTLASGDGVIKPRPGAHLRLEVKDPESRLSVISGTADFTNTAGAREVGKMKSLIFNTATHAPADLIAGMEDAPFDTWDAQQTEYQKRYSRGNALAGSGSSYGLADLNYYGAFSDVDGCGRIWRPYFASAAWDPYASGIWAWYPAGGYSWVSPYPWGWAPFHYGSWMQCGGGWGWQPGGGWYGLGRVREPIWNHDDPRHRHGPPRLHPLPPRPGVVPGKVSSLVAVNEKPLTFSHADRATLSFNFRNDSAGLGVPRGEFDKLNKLSPPAAKAGSSNVPLFVIPPDRPDLLPVGSGGLAARDGRASAARAGFFNRPGSANRDAQNAYAGQGGNLANVPHGGGPNRSPATRGAATSGTAAAYTGGNHPQGDRGNTAGYSSSPRGDYGGGGGYSGGGSVNGGGYNGGARPGGNSGGYAGGGGGGSHASAPAPSSPAPSAPSPSAPAAAAPSAHR